MFAHHLPSALTHPAETAFAHNIRQPLHSPWALVSELNGEPTSARTRGSNAAKKLRFERFENCERP
jgi:hypothetical protein